MISTIDYKEYDVLRALIKELTLKLKGEEVGYKISSNNFLGLITIHVQAYYVDGGITEYLAHDEYHTLSEYKETYHARDIESCLQILCAVEKRYI